jgi:hypothetical protein
MPRRLDEAAFERLCEQLAVAAAHCSDSQVLDLADRLHAMLRHRRAQPSVRALQRATNPRWGEGATPIAAPQHS